MDNPRSSEITSQCWVPIRSKNTRVRSGVGQIRAGSPPSDRNKRALYRIAARIAVPAGNRDELLKRSQRTTRRGRGTEIEAAWRGGNPPTIDRRNSTPRPRTPRQRRDPSCDTNSVNERVPPGQMKSRHSYASIDRSSFSRNRSARGSSSIDIV